MTLVATPVLAQTFSVDNGNDTVATREQGNTAVSRMAGPNYNGWNNGPPVVGPLFGAVTAPVAMATGGWTQANPSCGLYHDFNGRYTALCGL